MGRVIKARDIKAGKIVVKTLVWAEGEHGAIVPVGEATAAKSGGLRVVLERDRLPPAGDIVLFMDAHCHHGVA